MKDALVLIRFDKDVMKPEQIGIYANRIREASGLEVACLPNGLETSFYSAKMGIKILEEILEKLKIRLKVEEESK